MKRLIMAAALTAVLAGATACILGPPLPEGAELIPSDATFAVSVDLPAILKSDLYRKLLASWPYIGSNRLNFLKFATATGLDPSKDIERVLFIAGAGEQGIMAMSGLVIGDFDGRKVHDFLVESGLPSHRVEGVDLFEMVVLDGRCAFCLAVLDASTAAFGSEETLGRIAAVRSGAAPGLAEEPRAGRLLRRVGRNPEAWGIARSGRFKQRVEDLVSMLHGNRSALAALGPIEEVSFSLNASDPLRVLVELSATNDKDAMLVADVLRGAESLGRLALDESSAGMGALLSDMRIEADTGIVRVAVSIPSADIERVMGLLGGKGMAAAVSPPAGQTAPSP